MRQPIPFVGASSQARSLKANNQRAVNCFLELDNANPRQAVGLYGTPGLILRATLAYSGVRGAIRLGDYLYFVVADKVVRMSTAYALVTLAGSLGTASGAVSLASNGTEVLIVDGDKGWLVTGTTLAEVSDVDFPDGVTRATCQDGFFIVAGDGSGRFYINETPGSGTSWIGTDFASAEGSPDPVITCISDHREVWQFGTETIEVFVNTGAAFPFERSGNTFIEQGCGAAGSVAAMDNTLYWLGASKHGQGIVFKAQGYTPIRISDHDLEHALAGYSTIADAEAFCYQIEGHSFYVLTFPTANATWVHDAATGKWHEWLWRDPATNTLHRHRASCCVFFNGEHLVGDWESGKVYALDMATYADDEDPIMRLRRSQTQSKSGYQQFFGDMVVDMETGVGLATGQGSEPLLMRRYSDDGGRTWSDYETADIGEMGDYGVEVRFGPSGQGRDRVWEISMTDPVKFAVFGASVEVEPD